LLLLNNNLKKLLVVITRSIFYLEYSYSKLGKLKVVTHKISVKVWDNKSK